MLVTFSKLKTAILEASYPDTKIIEFYLSLRTSQERSITAILTDLRALVGVVTISIVQPTRSISETEHITLIKIKYAFGFSEKTNVIKELFYNIKKINGINMVKIMKKKKRIITNEPKENTQGIKF